MPRSRPQRRSSRRRGEGARIAQPAQPAGAPPAPPPGTDARRHEPPRADAGALTTAVQATGELAAIGRSVAARVMRGALGRLPGR